MGITQSKLALLRRNGSDETSIRRLIKLRGAGRQSTLLEQLHQPSAERNQKMASDCADAHSGAPEDSAHSGVKETSEAPKTCHVCKEPLEGHFGRAGHGRCFGKSVSTTFRDFAQLISSVQAELSFVKTELLCERVVARDREVRLSKKLAMLTGKLDECEERETALKAELREMSLRLEKLSNACTCHQSLGGLTEAVSRTSKKKKKKHKRAHTQVDNCVPHPDHDYVGDWGDSDGDTKVGDGTLASSEGEQEAVGPMECGEARSASKGVSEPES